MALKLSDLPTPPAHPLTILRFCENYNGYDSFGSFEKLAKFANRTSNYFGKHGKLAPSVKTTDDIQACLFFEGRRRHFVWMDEAEHDKYLWALIDGLRTKLQPQGS